MSAARIVAMDNVLDLGLLSDHAALAALIQGEHRVAWNRDIVLRDSLSGLAGSTLDDHASEVLYYQLARMGSARSTALDRLPVGGMLREVDKSGWGTTIAMLLDRYATEPDKWQPTKIQKNWGGSVEEVANVFSYARMALQTGSREVIDVILTRAPHAAGRTLLVTDLDLLCHESHGHELLCELLDRETVTVIPNPELPTAGLEHVAIEALRMNHLDMLRELARRGVDYQKPFALHAGCHTNLHLVSQGSAKDPIDKLFPVMLAHTPEAVQLLESFGAELQAVSPEVARGENVLFFALRRNDQEMMQWLVETRGFDVNVRNDDGFTPLHYAIRHGSEKIARYLIARGAQVSARSYDAGATPMQGVFAGNQPISKLKLLLAHGASLFECDYAGHYDWSGLRAAKDIAALTKMILQTIAHDAAAVNWSVVSDFVVHAISRKQMEAVLPILKTTHWDPQVVGHSKEPVLHAAIRQTGKRGVLRGQSRACLEIIELALSKGMDLELRDAQGYTPLMAAVSSQHPAAVDELLNRGASRSVRTASGTPLANLTRDKTMRAMLNSRLTTDAITHAMEDALDGQEDAPRPRKPAFNPL